MPLEACIQRTGFGGVAVALRRSSSCGCGKIMDTSKATASTENQLYADVMSPMCRPREQTFEFAMRGRLMRTRHGLCSPYLRFRRLPPQDLRLLSSYLADCLKVTSTPHQGRGAALYSACPAIRMSGRRDDDEAETYPGFCSKARKVPSTFGQCRIQFNGH